MAKLGIPPENLDPTRYRGPRFNVTPLTEANRRPTVLDRIYPLFTLWRVRSPVSGAGNEGEIWYLARFVDSEAGFNPGDAIWLMLATGTSGPVVNFDVDFETDPGVDPVVPTAAGLVSVFGNTVTNATNTNAPVATHTRAINQFQIDVQLAAAVAATPGDPFDAGLASFNDAHFSVDGNGFVSLIGGGQAIDTLTGDAGGAVGPDAAGNIDVQGVTVANAANAKPVFVQGTPGSNLLEVDVQVGAAITGAPGDKLDAGLASFDDTQFTVDADGFVSLIGSGPATTTLTGDAGGAVGPDAAGNIDVQGVTVANAANAKPVFVQGTPGSNLLEVDVQVGAAITGAPGDKLDAGLASFDDTQFTVDADGFVQLITPVPGGGSWVFLAEATASSSAAVEFTSDIDSTYDMYLVTITNISIENVDPLFLRVSSDGGMSYDSGATDYQTPGTTFLTTSQSSEIDLTPGNSIDNTADIYSGFVYMLEPANLNKRTFFQVNSTWDPSGANPKAISSMGFRNTNSAVDAIQFSAPTGNIDTGTFRLYGLKTS